MDKYIATKPVRFDRNYAVGDIIPAIVINPGQIKRLIEWGKIQRLPEENLLGGDFETSVAFVEEILGIDHGDEPPDIGERAEICKERITVISNFAAQVNSEADTEKGLAFVEELLGISYDESSTETPPLSVEERTEIIKTIVADLRAQKADADLDNSDGQDDGKQGDETDDPAGNPETPTGDAEGAGGTNTPPTPENEQDGQAGNAQGATGTPANVQTVNLTGQPPAEGTGDNDLACPVCGRVMGSKAALTTHIKKEHPDYKA